MFSNRSSLLLEAFAFLAFLATLRPPGMLTRFYSDTLFQTLSVTESN